MYLKYLMTVFIALQLAGCVNTNYLDCSVSKRKFSEGNYAIVITSIKDMSNKRANFTLARADANYHDKKKRFNYRVLDKDLYFFGKIADYDIAMIEPGAYVLEDIAVSYYVGDMIYTYSTTADGLTPTSERFVYGGFSAKKGEVVYLGNLKMDLIQGRVPTELIDTYDEAVKYFHKKYPSLTSYSVKKDHLKPAGTFLSSLNP